MVEIKMFKYDSIRWTGTRTGTWDLAAFRNIKYYRKLQLL